MKTRLKVLCFGFSIFEQFDLNHVCLFALRKMKMNEKEKKVESLTISGKFQAYIIQAFVPQASSGVVDGSTQTVSVRSSLSVSMFLSMGQPSCPLAGDWTISCQSHTKFQMRL